ncbi:MAG TPA: esterase-like activity of phytase family protein [Solimonas sp.]|nr:esterase-like activity of phytase family protein [Solimonas sp.]
MNSCKQMGGVCKSAYKFAQLALVAGGLLAAGLSPAGAAVPAPFEPLTEIRDVDLPELSGLAASRRWPGIYWAHNDSGGTPTLYAFNRRGEVIARVAIDGAEAVDWEDLALYEHDGRSWLAIADTGDNLAWRSSVSIYLLPEPALDASRAAVSRHIEFRYPEGPRDAEGLAVDAEGGRLLVMEKAVPRAALYSLPLDAPPGVVLAERVAEVALRRPTPPRPAEPLSAPRGAGSVTAMDLSRDGRELVLMTYGFVFDFARAPGESWAQVLAQPPRVWRLPRIKGLEAMAIEPDGRSLVVAPEGMPSAVWRAKGILGR